MAQNYQKIGDYISVLDNRNADGSITNLMGISIDKCYIPSVANVIGTDLNNYKVIRKGQFACSLMQVSRDQRIPLAMYTSDEPAIMSPAYVMFEVNRPDVLLPEYMELWFKRAEFDREASFYAVGGVRGSLDWEDFCKMKLPVPSIFEQRKIVHDYQVITDRIELLLKMNESLEEQEDVIFQVRYSKKSWRDGRFFELIVGNIPGDWGSDTIKGNKNSQVTCIRGADIPGLTVGMTMDAPIRYIMEKNYLSKSLPANSMIIEMSGGSPTQSTGRIALLTDVIRTKLNHRVICSNFCRAITVKREYLYFFYLAWRHLYKINRLFDYENSTIGLKNFDYQSFITQEVIKIPTVEEGRRLNELIEPIHNAIITNGSEIEMLKRLQTVILPTIMR